MDKIKALTLEAVKEQFCITDKREALEKIGDSLASAWSIERAAELTAQIGEQMDKMCKDEGITFSPAQRIMWAVKEAYIRGCLSTAEKFMIAADMGYEALAGEEGEHE